MFEKVCWIDWCSCCSTFNASFLYY
jgi:hypothetical protein